MFIIHRDQVEAMGQRRRADFEHRARLYLSWVLERDVPLAFIEEAVRRAMARGFDTDNRAWQYIAIEAFLGGDMFLHWPWAEAIVCNDALTSLGKLRVLLREARERGLPHGPVDDVSEVER